MGLSVLRRVDSDGSGDLDVIEFQEALRRMGQDLTPNQVILPTAHGVSNEGGVLPSWFPCRLFLGPGSGLRLVGTASARR